jgi:hypothetical protein
MMKSIQRVAPRRSMVCFGQLKLRTVCRLVDDQDAGKDEQDAVGGQNTEQDALINLKEELDALHAEKEAALAKVAELAAVIAEHDAQLKMKKKINPYTLMTSPLPSFTDISSPGTSISWSVERMDVRKVEQNVGFKARQKIFTLSIEKEFELRGAVDEDIILSLSGAVAGCQLDIERAVYSTAFMVLDRLLDDVMTSSPASAGITVGADGVSCLKKSTTALVVYEAKRRNLVSHGTDLVQSCKLKIMDPNTRAVSKDSLDAIQQIVGYMVIANVFFGILTTGKFYWALELQGDGSVLISEPYRCQDEGANSVVSMIYYVIHLAREMDESGKKPAPPPLRRLSEPSPADDLDSASGVSNSNSGDSDGDSGRKGKAPTSEASIGKALEAPLRFDKSRFKCLRILLEHPDRVTFQAQVGGAEDSHVLVAVKAFDTAKARDSEAAKYRMLKPLQAAGAIPALLKGELRLGWTERDERRVHALVVSWVGPPDTEDHVAVPLSLPTNALHRVRETLEEMHALGVAHGDVRLQNLAYDPVTGRVFVLDLSHSVARGEADFGSQCADDMMGIDHLIAEAQALQGPDLSAAR